MSFRLAFFKSRQSRSAKPNGIQSDGRTDKACTICVLSSATLVPTADGRIVMGGSDFSYYPNDELSSGNDKFYTRKVIKDLFAFFPSLAGLKIEHAWGGTTTYTMDRTPSVGVMGDYRNIYYGIGLS